MKLHPNLSFESLTTQQAWQSDALLHQLEYLQHHSPYYQRLFKKHHINIHQVKSLNDIPFLPVTSKSDMQEHNWDFLCVPSAQVKEYTATSGTLGKAVTIALTERDLKRLAYNERQSFACAGGTPDDIYQLMLTLDRQFMAGMAYYMGIRDLGAAVVRTGPGLPSMQWDTIFRLQSNGLVTVPSFLLKMIEWANEHKTDLKQTPVQKAVCIGENIRGGDFELNALGQKIQEQWPLKLYSTYASTEMQTAFTECSAGNGGHHQPDLLIVEILDEHDRPLKDGEYGEVVITTLGVEGMPLLRYRTGDICALYSYPCACGRLSQRLSPVLGRKQQMIKYKGTTLYPPAIFDILNQVNFVKEYQVEVFTNDLGLDDIRLHINTPLPVDECDRKIKPMLQSRLRVIPHIQYHPAEAMQQMQFPAGSRKQIKFIDNRDSL